MSKNKRAPKELQRYVVCERELRPGALRETFHYCRTQKEAQAWVNGRAGGYVKFELFRVDFDFYGELKRKVRK